MYILGEDNGEDLRSNLDQIIADNDQSLIDVDGLARDAKAHAEQLYQHSLDLDSLLTDTRNTSAVRAASAYKDITETIHAANQAAEDAVSAANNATELVSRDSVQLF